MITKLTEDQNGDVKGGVWYPTNPDGDKTACEIACESFCPKPDGALDYRYDQGQPQYRM